jgi:hypothetical protein
MGQIVGPVCTCIIQTNVSVVVLAVSRGLSPREPGFDPCSVHVIFVVKWQWIRFFFEGIILPIFCTHLSDIGEHGAGKDFRTVLLILVCKPFVVKK